MWWEDFFRQERNFFISLVNFWEIISRHPCLQTKNIMVSSSRSKEASQAKYISILNIIQGEVDPTQVSILNAQETKIWFLGDGYYSRVTYYSYFTMFVGVKQIQFNYKDLLCDCYVSVYCNIIRMCPNESFLSFLVYA